MILLDAATEAALAALNVASFSIDAAVCLGSGLGGGVEAVASKLDIPYESLPLLGSCRVPGHAGFLRIGRIGKLNVAVFSGRRHFYETGEMAVAAGAARVAARLGARFFVSMSAVGGADPALSVGAWVFVEDHINLMGQNPLLGVSGEHSPPFVDLSSVYRTDLFPHIAEILPPSIDVYRATLAAFCGPTYETPAEVRMARTLGASIVSMSTVPEAVWGKYLGMDVAAWGLVANPASGVGAGPLTHAEVLGAARAASADAGEILRATLKAWERAGGAG